MIRLVIVAMIDTSSPKIVRVRNLAHDFRLIPGILQVEHTEMLLPSHIDINRRERTCAFMRTSVRATHRSSLRGIFSLEPSERTISHDALAWFPYEPTQDIQVMAALGQDYRRGLVRITPVSAHV